jgi:glycolate oxidase FAD binding subunit
VPTREASLRFAMGEIDALARLNEWAGQPLPISASCWHRGVLSLRLSGADAAVTAALAKLGGEPFDDGPAFWDGLRDQSHSYFDGGAVWRLSLPPAASAIILRGEQLIEWGGAQRWLKVDNTANPANQANQADGADIRRAVAAAGGHATLFRSADKSAGVFHPLAPALTAIHQRLKQSFDPSGIFNPGRMY